MSKYCAACSVVGPSILVMRQLCSNSRFRHAFLSTIVLGHVLHSKYSASVQEYSWINVWKLRTKARES